MWTLVLSILSTVLGWFGRKSDAQIGLDKGEQLGQAETKAAQDDKALKDIADADAARQSAPAYDDPKLREPDPFERHE